MSVDPVDPHEVHITYKISYLILIITDPVNYFINTSFTSKGSGICDRLYSRFSRQSIAINRERAIGVYKNVFGHGRA